MLQSKLGGHHFLMKKRLYYLYCKEDQRVECKISIHLLYVVFVCAKVCADKYT